MSSQAEILRRKASILPARGEGCRPRPELAGALTLLAAATAASLALAIAFPYLPLLSMTVQVAPHLGGLLVLLAGALLTLRRPLRAALAGASGLAALAYVVAQVLPVMAPAPQEPGQALLKLVSFNVLGTNPNGEAIASYLASTGADVAFVLEAAPLFDALPRLSAVFPYRVGCDSRGACDSLLLSRHPLDAVSVRDLSHFSPDRDLEARVAIDGRTVTLLDVHLTKPYFDAAEEGEIAALVRQVRKIDGPVVVAGDFNAAPWSPPLVTLTREAGLRFGPRLVSTWPVLAGGAGVPIDHVLTGGPAEIVQLGALPSAFGSNHRGLVAEIGLGSAPRGTARP